MPTHTRIQVKKSERIRFILNPETFLEQTRLADGFIKMCDEMYTEVVESSPVDKGLYKNSWNSSTNSTPKRLTFKFTNNVDYAKFLIYGMDINFRRFIRTSRGYTGHSYKYPDPMRGILHDVRRIMWNYRNKYIEEFQRTRTMYRATTGRKVSVSNVRTIKSFTTGGRYI